RRPSAVTYAVLTYFEPPRAAGPTPHLRRTLLVSGPTWSERLRSLRRPPKGRPSRGPASTPAMLWQRYRHIFINLNPLLPQIRPRAHPCQNVWLVCLSGGAHQGRSLPNRAQNFANSPLKSGFPADIATR